MAMSHLARNTHEPGTAYPATGGSGKSDDPPRRRSAGNRRSTGRRPVTDDFKRGALPGARNLPFDALAYDYAKLDKSEPVILYGSQAVVCARAARLLAGKGFSHIYHLANPA